MRTQRTYNQNRESHSRNGNSYDRFNRDRNTSSERYGRNNYRDTEGGSAGWDQDYDETEARTYSRDHDNTYPDNYHYENRGGSYSGSSDYGYQGRNSDRNNYYENQHSGSDYDRSANYDFDDEDENEFSENADRNYGGSSYGRSSYGTGQNGNYGYDRNTGRQGPNRNYPPYGTDSNSNYESGRDRNYETTTDREDARNQYGTGSSYANGNRSTNGNRSRYGRTGSNSRSYSSRGSRNYQY